MAKTSGKKDKGDKVLPKGVSGKKVKDNLKKGKSSELDKSKKKKSSSDSTNSSSSSDAAHVWTPEEMQKFCAIGSGFGLLLVSSGFGTCFRAVGVLPAVEKNFLVWVIRISR